MKKEDVQVGMKVVPHQKTARSFEWDFEDYQDSNGEVPSFLRQNGFVYVLGFDKDMNAFVLGLSEKIEQLDGDFFNHEDFEPFATIKEQDFNEEYWA